MKIDGSAVVEVHASLIGETLLEKARQAARLAYAPYSNFHVGAALLAKNGEVFIGCNVENASYGLSICAERSAVASAVSAGCREFAAIAIVGGQEGASGGRPCLPCGACLQVLVEFSPQMTVWVEETVGDERGDVDASSDFFSVRSYRLDDLMPEAFRLT